MNESDRWFIASVAAWLASMMYLVNDENFWWLVWGLMAGMMFIMSAALRGTKK